MESFRGRGRGWSLLITGNSFDEVIRQPGSPLHSMTIPSPTTREHDIGGRSVCLPPVRQLRNRSPGRPITLGRRCSPPPIIDFSSIEESGFQTPLEEKILMLLTGVDLQERPQKLQQFVERVHPAIEYKIEDWIEWVKVSCNEDFLMYPPLLQYKEFFPHTLEKWKAMKCILCNLVCPPPPYSCDNYHVLCFSCTSVIRDSLCPLILDSTETPGLRCGKLLQTMFTTGFDFETLFEFPRTRYNCPYKKFGCDHPGNLFPAEVVEHAQKECMFRYAIKCCIDGCIGQQVLIRFGHIQDHFIGIHKSNVVDLKDHKKTQPLAQNLDLFLTPVEQTTVPFIFVDPEQEISVIFLLVMKTDENVVQYWIYTISVPGSNPGVFEGDVTLCPIMKKLKGLETQPTEIIAKNVIHDFSVSEDEVVKSGRLISIKLTTFAEKYLTHYHTIKGGREVARCFYTLKASIIKMDDFYSGVDFDMEAYEAGEKLVREMIRELDLNKSRKLAVDLSSLKYSIKNAGFRRRSQNQE